MPSNSFGESSCTAAASGLVQVRGARENILKEVDVSISRGMRWWCSRVSPAPGSPRWPSAPSMPRHSDAILSRWPPMHGA